MANQDDDDRGCYTVLLDADTQNGNEIMILYKFCSARLIAQPHHRGGATSSARFTSCSQHLTAHQADFLGIDDAKDDREDE